MGSDQSPCMQACHFRPGEHEPGAMVLEAPPLQLPSLDELTVESLMSSASIASSLRVNRGQSRSLCGGRCRA
jgi:hypothetical protein